MVKKNIDIVANIGKISLIDYAAGCNVIAFDPLP
jgi:hypothetical protein